MGGRHNQWTVVCAEVRGQIVKGGVKGEAVGVSPRCHTLLSKYHARFREESVRDDVDVDRHWREWFGS